MLAHELHALARARAGAAACGNAVAYAGLIVSESTPRDADAYAARKLASSSNRVAGTMRLGISSSTAFLQKHQGLIRNSSGAFREITSGCGGAPGCPSTSTFLKGGSVQQIHRLSASMAPSKRKL